MSIGINQSCIMQVRLEEFIRASSAAGIREVELRVPKLTEVHHYMGSSAIRDLLQQHQITVTSVNSLDDFGLVPEENLTHLRREAEQMIDFCRACDCHLVIAPVARWFDGAPDRAWVTETTAKRLHFIADILGEAGIEVGFEPIAFATFTVWSLEHSAEIIEASGASNVSLIADVYNLARGDSGPESMRRFGDTISLIHLDDSPSLDLETLDLIHARVFPGDGVLRPEDWVCAAKAGGFSGRLSIEIFREDLWQLNAEAAAGQCARKCAAFEKLLAAC